METWRKHLHERDRRIDAGTMAMKFEVEISYPPTSTSSDETHMVYYFNNKDQKFLKDFKESVKLTFPNELRGVLVGKIQHKPKALSDRTFRTVEALVRRALQQQGAKIIPPSSLMKLKRKLQKTGQLDPNFFISHAADLEELSEKLGIATVRITHI